MSDRDAGVRDLFFLGVAVVLHGALFAVNPGLRWGAAAKAERIIPVEFVQAPVSPFLAPIPPGDGKGDEMPDHGPGPVITPQTRQVEPKAKPQLSLPKQTKPKPVLTVKKVLQKAPKSKVPAPKPRTPKPSMAVQKGPSPAQLARIQAQIVASQKRQKRLELSRELAQLDNPDESLAESVEAQASSGGLQRSAASLEEGPPGEDRSDLRDSLNSQPSASPRTVREGMDDTNQPMGGGVKRTEGSISWSIDGPIGSRRLLKRSLPVSPEWVSQRGLDLTVQVKFQVLEDGSVKRGAIIKVTSGFPELDRLALDAIKLWRFEAVPKADSAAPQTWGVVTFRFTMG
ncbi:MAG: TonB family protein [Elusimicrobia bacterium]|nr:TonB family protein [Elusimicrobiota bacterium]